MKKKMLNKQEQVREGGGTWRPRTIGEQVAVTKISAGGGRGLVGSEWTGGVAAPRCGGPAPPNWRGQPATPRCRQQWPPLWAVAPRCRQWRPMAPRHCRPVPRRGRRWPPSWAAVHGQAGGRQRRRADSNNGGQVGGERRWLGSAVWVGWHAQAGGSVVSSAGGQTHVAFG
jgi:hypothetical protein